MLNGVKWHVTSFNTADYAFFQAKKIDDPERGRPAPGAGHLLFLVDVPSPGVSVPEPSAFAAARVFGGIPIAGHGLVAGMLADCVTELFAARSMLHETARAIDRDPADTRTAHARCSMIKLYCSEMAGRVADRAVQAFGGRGYLRENVAERFFRELRVERIWEGTGEIQRMIIARQLTSRGVPALV